MTSAPAAAVQVRLARPEDAFAVAALHLQHDLGAGARPESGFLDRFADWWLRHGDAHPTWLATAPDGSPVGVLMGSLVEARPRVGRATERWLDLTFVFVAAPHRRRGVARRLVTECQTWAGVHGLSRIQLRSTDEARALYAAQGFGPACADLLEWRPVAG